MCRPLILDFDGSVLPLDGVERVSLRHEEEAIRFGCRMAELRRLQSELEPHLAANPRLVFLGSGDLHHVSTILIERLRRLSTPITVVVFDNHPDNMRYPFGIHCGSWVRHVAELPFVARVLVAGVTSTDVEGLHVFENRLGPLRRGKIVYWCVTRNLRLLHFLGATESRSFRSVGEMLGELAAVREPVYVSIDKDVLAPEVVQTNWDQGVMHLEELESAIRVLQPRIIGSDVVGDVSSYAYRSRMKRFLSALDGQPAIPPESLPEWQEAHRAVNERLLTLLARG